MEEKIEESIIDTTSLYSLKSIGIATFIGGPLAAGYLIKHNFVCLGNEEAGKNAMIIGIVSTIVVFASIFLTPEEILDKVPNSLIPGVYTLIIYFLAKYYQGNDLEEHEFKRGGFESAWKAAGIGVVSMLIIFFGIFIVILFAGV